MKCFQSNAVRIGIIFLFITVSTGRANIAVSAGAGFAAARTLTAATFSGSAIACIITFGTGKCVVFTDFAFAACNAME